MIRGIGYIASAGVGFLAAVVIIWGQMQARPTTPTRSYDASTGVTCYSIPGAISCVKTAEP